MQIQKTNNTPAFGCKLDKVGKVVEYCQPIKDAIKIVEDKGNSLEAAQGFVDNFVKMAEKQTKDPHDTIAKNLLKETRKAFGLDK